MLANLVRHAREAGASAIEAEYIPTPKNGMVAGLYPRLGFTETARRDDGRVQFRLDVASANAAPPAWLTIEETLEDAVVAK